MANFHEGPNVAPIIKMWAEYADDQIEPPIPIASFAEQKALFRVLSADEDDNLKACQVFAERLGHPDNPAIRSVTQTPGFLDAPRARILFDDARKIDFETTEELVLNPSGQVPLALDNLADSLDNPAVTNLRRVTVSHQVGSPCVLAQVDFYMDTDNFTDSQNRERFAQLLGRRGIVTRYELGGNGAYQDIAHIAIGSLGIQASFRNERGIPLNEPVPIPDW